MEVTGKIIAALPEVTGTSKAGNQWKKREYVLETINDQFPKKIHFDFFGEKADQYPLSVGEVITLSFDIESREYNGRWYTSIRGWKSAPATAATAAQAAPAQAAAPASFAGVQAPPAPAYSAPVPAADDDLPF